MITEDLSIWKDADEKIAAARVAELRWVRQRQEEHTRGWEADGNDNAYGPDFNAAEKAWGDTDDEIDARIATITSGVPEPKQYSKEHVQCACGLWVDADAETFIKKDDAWVPVIFESLKVGDVFRQRGRVMRVENEAPARKQQMITSWQLWASEVKDGDGPG
jgi:hypothetical protein